MRARRRPRAKPAASTQEAVTLPSPGFSGTRETTRTTASTTSSGRSRRDGPGRARAGPGGRMAGGRVPTGSG